MSINKLELNAPVVSVIDLALIRVILLDKVSKMPLNKHQVIHAESFDPVLEDLLLGHPAHEQVSEGQFGNFRLFGCVEL